MAEVYIAAGMAFFVMALSIIMVWRNERKKRKKEAEQMKKISDKINDAKSQLDVVEKRVKEL